MRLRLAPLAGILLAALCLACASNALAATMYQLDIVVFARPGGGNEEGSASAKGLAWPSRLALLQTAPADATSVGPWQLLPATARTLEAEAAALKKRGFPILFQGAWRQGVDTATRATSVRLAGGRAVGSRHELEGYVTLSAEGYLHLYADLWLSRFGDAIAPGGPIMLPNPDGAFGEEADANAPNIERLFVLRQHRRLRNGELHYLDHPRFGALVRVRPVE
jgi:hypothetical protein